MTTPDPALMALAGLSKRGIENLAMAERFIALTIGYGHGPGAMAKKGERIAGFYYRNDVARENELLPTHSIGAIRDLILELAALAKEPPNVR